MKRVHWVLAGAFLLAGAAALTAGGLSRRFKNWDKSPEAYFLTRDEHEQWKKVKTDEEAQNFILDYKAKRGPDFQKMLDERIAAADKYFSAGETKGSETLRGKVIIVFGPPSGIDSDLSKKGKKADISSSTGAPPSMGDAGRNSGLALSSGGAGPIGTAPRHVDAPTFTFHYDEQAAPKAIGKPFDVDLKLISNATQEAWDEKDLNAKFEAVAKASAAPPPPENKPEPKPEPKPGNGS